MLQLQSMNAKLSLGLWNLIHLHFDEPVGTWNDLVRNLTLAGVIPADLSIANSSHLYCAQWLREHWTKAAWNERYDIVDEICSEPDKYFGTETNPMNVRDTFVGMVNAVLQREGAGWRVNRTLLVPITNETELATIHAAAESDFPKASAHVAKALGLFSQRPEPDYANSVKEVVHAVEVAVRLVSDVPETGVAAAVKELVKRGMLAQTLAESITKLYGYASGNDIRKPAKPGSVPVGYPEALLALVTCSAIVNFIAAKTRGE